jgi:hypothetical protein
MEDLLRLENPSFLDQELGLKDPDLKRYQNNASSFTTYVPRRS